MNIVDTSSDCYKKTQKKTSSSMSGKNITQKIYDVLSHIQKQIFQTVFHYYLAAKFVEIILLKKKQFR